MRADKPIGFFLLWWPVMWALWLVSDGSPSIKNIIIFSLGCFLMRSAGCVINDFADRKIDKHVERTKARPLTSGVVTAKEALGLFAVLCLLAFILVLQTNLQTILLSIPALFLATLYPFTKRWFMFPQFFLGAAFSWGVVMVAPAQETSLQLWLFVLYFAVLLWTVAYDTFYAMVDREDDLKIGVKSTAIWFGKHDKLITALLQVLFLLLLIYVGVSKQLPWIYYVSLVIAAALSIYQHYLIKDYDRDKCFKAFLNNQWVGMIIFIGIFFSYLIV